MSGQTITVQVTDFKRGVRYARSWGRFDGGSKTWTLDVSRMGTAINSIDERGFLNGYGLRVVAPSSHCGRWIADQGCPMHGELCHEHPELF